MCSVTQSSRVRLLVTPWTVACQAPLSMELSQAKILQWVARRRKQQPTLVLLPGKFHGQRSLGGYTPWGCKESDTIERLQCQCQCQYYLLLPGMCVCVLVTQWCLTLRNLMDYIAHQAPLSMGLSRLEYWSGLPFPSLEELSEPEIKPASPALAGGFFAT